MFQSRAVLAFLFFAAGFEPSAAQPEQWVIRVCEIELTELGRRARFELSYFYSIETGESGEVAAVRKDLREHPPLVREERFEPCLRSWRLRPSSEYGVGISVTSTGRNAISVEGGGDLKLRLVVP